MPKMAITQSSAKKAVCHPSKNKTDYFDNRLTGFGLEVRKSGRKSFFVRYTDPYGKTRQQVVGDADLLSASEARSKARETLRQIEIGEDPLSKKTDRRNVPTVDEFKDVYLDFAKAHKKSWKIDASILKNQILPAIGHKRLDQLTPRDFLHLQSTLRDKGLAPATNDRVQILCRYMLNLAVRWESFGIKENPASKISLLNPNNVVNRYLSRDQVGALVRVLREPRYDDVRPVILLALLTGARRGEAMTATWADVDLEEGTWRIPETKSGKPLLVPLSGYLLAYLKDLRQHATTPYVCPNPNTGKPFVHIYKKWHEIRQRAGVPDLRFHDLRHTFASLLINNQRSLYEVQHLLGHSQTRTTQRYAHLSHHTLKAATDTVGVFIEGTTDK